MNNKIMALDVGSKRIGISMASVVAKLPAPFKTIDYDGAVEEIVKLIENESVIELVVGLPLNRDNQPTAQTEFTEEFINKLSPKINIPIKTCDEAMSSIRAKHELKARGIKYAKSDVDSLAATYILEDYLKEGS